jgi:hypothetical protein
MTTANRPDAGTYCRLASLPTGSVVTKLAHRQVIRLQSNAYRGLSLRKCLDLLACSLLQGSLTTRRLRAQNLFT